MSFAASYKQLECDTPQPRETSPESEGHFISFYDYWPQPLASILPVCPPMSSWATASFLTSRAATPVPIIPAARNEPKLLAQSQDHQTHKRMYPWRFIGMEALTPPAGSAGLYGPVRSRAHALMRSCAHRWGAMRSSKA